MNRLNNTNLYPLDNVSDTVIAQTMRSSCFNTSSNKPIIIDNNRLIDNKEKASRYITQRLTNGPTDSQIEEKTERKVNEHKSNNTRSLFAPTRSLRSHFDILQGLHELQQQGVDPVGHNESDDFNNDIMSDFSIFGVDYPYGHISSLSQLFATLPEIISSRTRDMYMNANPSALLEDVPTPLKDHHRDRLEKCKVSDITPNKIGRDELYTDCAICQTNFDPVQTVIILPCSGHHYFHDECVEEWLGSFSKKCPVCRENIEDILLKV